MEINQHYKPYFLDRGKYLCGVGKTIYGTITIANTINLDILLFNHDVKLLSNNDC